MKKVAVTGGLGSGKTAVCQFLAECGAYVVSADEIVRQLLSPQTAVGQQVIDLLGPEILQGKILDRKKIGASVFTDLNKLRALEGILHPAVLNEIKTHYSQALTTGRYPLFVAEIPLLYESESHPFFDAVIAVIAPEELCQDRFQKTTGSSVEEYARRAQRQLPQEAKAARATYTLTNEGSLEDLRTAVFKLYALITENYEPR